MSTGRLLTEYITLPDGTRMPARKAGTTIYTLADPAALTVGDIVDHEGELFTVAAIDRTWDRVTMLHTMSDEREEEVWEHGLYRDTANGDLWRLDIIIAPDGVTRIERWQWMNGNRWSHVPRETLEKLPDGLTEAMLR